MSRDDLIPFQDFTEFPTGHHVGDATIFLNAGHDHLGHQLATAADQQFAVLFDALGFTHIHHDKIPFGIGHHHLAFECVG